MMGLIRTRDSRSAMVARLTLGLVMLPHGAQKAFGWFGGEGLRATIEEMSQQGIPVSLALAVVAGELLASLALVVGFCGRLAAAVIFVIMLGAIGLVHIENGFFMNWTGAQAGEGFEYHLLAMGLALVVCMKGSGAHSVDRELTRRDVKPSYFESRAPLAHVGASTPDAQ
jgi:putative oxidoreductase